MRDLLPCVYQVDLFRDRAERKKEQVCSIHEYKVAFQRADQVPKGVEHLILLTGEYRYHIMRSIFSTEMNRNTYRLPPHGVFRECPRFEDEPLGYPRAQWSIRAVRFREQVQCGR